MAWDTLFEVGKGQERYIIGEKDMMQKVDSEQMTASANNHDVEQQLLALYKQLDHSEAKKRLTALNNLRNILRKNGEILLPIAKQEMDPFTKGTYFPFGLMVLLAGAYNSIPYSTIYKALETYLWRDRGIIWGLPEQDNNLYLLLLRFYAKNWPKNSWGLLPLGAANLDSNTKSLFSPKLQFQYLTHAFFKPKTKYGSFFDESDDVTKEFVRRRITLYMMGWYQKGQCHYDRKKFGTTKHWLKCYHNLCDVNLSTIPEALPHLVYLSIVAKNEERTELLNILKQNFSWFPEDIWNSLATAQEDFTFEISAIVQQSFTHYWMDAQNQQHIRISGYLAIKALVEQEFLSSESALEWMLGLSMQNGNDPHVWVVRAEALAACGPQALDELEEMSANKDQPPEVRRSMLHYITLVKDERSLCILADIVDPDNQKDPVLVEGALICLSRIPAQDRWMGKGKDKVVGATEKLWNMLESAQTEQQEETQNFQWLIFQVFQLVQSNISANILSAALHSKNPLVQLGALRLQFMLLAREREDSLYTLSNDLIDQFRAIIFQAGQYAGNHIHQLLQLLAYLASLPALANILFNEAFYHEMLTLRITSLRPAIIKLIRVTKTNLISVFKQPSGEFANFLSFSSLLEMNQDVGVRLGAMSILSSWPELWSLDNVNKSILQQADPDQNQEPFTSSKALELLVKHRLHDIKTSDVLMKWCLKLDHAQSHTAIKLIGENIFSFKLPSDVSNRLFDSVKTCYAHTSVSAHYRNDFSIFSLCRFYTLLLRINAVPALWPTFNIIFHQTIAHLMVAKSRNLKYWTKTGGRVLRGMLSAFRLALGTDYSNISGGRDNFTAPLREISKFCENQITNSQEYRTHLMASYLGLSLYREPPQVLYEAFNQLNIQLKTLFIDKDIHTNSKTLHEMIRTARTTVRDIAKQLDVKAKNNEKKSHLEQTPYCHTNTSLGIALQKYLDNPSADIFFEVKQNIEDLFPVGTEDTWLQFFWDYSAAYLTKRQRSQETWWLNTTRFLLHNLDRQAQNIPIDSDNATTHLARRFLSLPSLINSLMLNVPEEIPLAEFIKQSKKKLEDNFHHPNSLCLMEIVQDLKVSFDKRRLFSILENCFTNAQQSVEKYNQDAAKAKPPLGVRVLTVQISAQNTENGVEIVIEDNGNGLPISFITTPEGHYGLGTFIIRSYIESAGGKVAWEKKNPNKNIEGARVRLQFPYMENSTDA